MRAALAAQHPELCPRFARVGSLADTLRAAEGMTYPLILKPVSGSGSKGIYRVNDRTELESAYAALAALVDPVRDPIFTGHAGDLIVEEFLQGSEHSVEGVVFQGKPVVFGVTDKSTSEPYRLETGHVFPSQLPQEALDSIDDLVTKTVDAFGLDNSAFHLECIVGSDGRARLVECAARAGGGFITSDLIGLATGADAATQIVRVALGQAPQAASPRMVAGVRKLMAERPGTLQEITGLDEALRVPGVTRIVLERPIGAAVQLPPEDFTSSVIGMVIAVAPTAPELDEALSSAMSSLTAVIA